jgi:hypothetical protein
MADKAVGTGVDHALILFYPDGASRALVYAKHPAHKERRRDDQSVTNKCERRGDLAKNSSREAEAVIEARKEHYEEEQGAKCANESQLAPSPFNGLQSALDYGRGPNEKCEANRGDGKKNDWKIIRGLPEPERPGRRKQDGCQEHQPAEQAHAQPDTESVERPYTCGVKDGGLNDFRSLWRHPVILLAGIPMARDAGETQLVRRVTRRQSWCVNGKAYSSLGTARIPFRGEGGGQLAESA